MRTPSHPTRMEVPLTYYSAMKSTRTLFCLEFASGGLVIDSGTRQDLIRGVRDFALRLRLTHTGRLLSDDSEKR